MSCFYDKINIFIYPASITAIFFLVYLDLNNPVAFNQLEDINYSLKIIIPILHVLGH